MNEFPETLPRVTYTNLHEDFAGVHAHLDAVIPRVEADVLGQRHGHVVDGEERAGGEVAVASPIDDRLILGSFATATPQIVDDAVAAARRATADWRRLGWQGRVALLRAGADVLARRKYEVSVACLIEVGKSRLEAVGEVEEAIDLIRYYCNEIERADGYAVDRPPAVARERSSDVLRPYGVFAVIAPFNFPVALSLAMVTAALVAGNTVVFKPGERSGLSGRMLVDCLHAGGVPGGALNLVLGGGAVGAALAGHDGVDGVAFTGSNAVGMAILREATARHAARPVLAEMGGKNPAFVTASADLDTAAAGVMRSAFGLQGQKCSALGKVYVAREVEAAFVERLTALTAAIAPGDPRARDVFMGPLVGPASLDRFLAASAEARRGGRVLLGGERSRGGPLDHGAYVAPTIVAGLAADHRLNRDELFLPFLSILSYDVLDEAITSANRSELGLAAGIYTRDDAELDRFLDTIEAGVLYANRASGATTGAWPGIQTFCGWKGSGTTGKGGLGPWYVPQFMREQSRTLFG